MLSKHPLQEFTSIFIFLPLMMANFGRALTDSLVCANPSYDLNWILPFPLAIPPTLLFVGAKVEELFFPYLVFFPLELPLYWKKWESNNKW